jgi:lysophospholipase L1-like esterase
MKRQFVVLLAIVLIALGSRVADSGFAAPKSTIPALPGAYLSLGDSLAYGAGASDPATQGFASLLHRALQPGSSGEASRPGDFVNLGRLGGETSASMVSGQLPQAIAAILARNLTPSPVDDVRVITISIGGNDFFGLLGVCQTTTFPPDPASQCAQALSQAYAGFAANFAAILAQLKSAAGPDVKVAVLTYYNSLPACFLAGLAPLAEIGLEGDGAFIPGLNNLIRGIAAQYQAVAVEGYGLLEVGDLVGGQDCLHPNDSGHAKLAWVFAEALDQFP